MGWPDNAGKEDIANGACAKGIEVICDTAHSLVLWTLRYPILNAIIPAQACISFKARLSVAA